MTVPIIKKPNWTIALGLPILVFAACYLITQTSKFEQHSQFLSVAVVIDLLVTAPLLYFLIIRKSSARKATVLRIFIIGATLAAFMFKDQPNGLLRFIKTFISPTIEGMLIYLVARKFYIANRVAKAGTGNSADFLVHCRNVMGEITGNEKAGNIIASEISVIYYAFISRKDKAVDYKTEFSIYKESSLLLVLGAILSIFLIETAAAHFLFALWNHRIAWILTGLSVYTCLQLYAHMKAIRARPLKITVHSLEIHNGLAGDAYIPFDMIDRFEMTSKVPKNCAPIKMSLLKGLENHNVAVYLKAPMVVTKLFGIKKTTDTVLFFVDQPLLFKEALLIAMEGCN